MKIIIFNTPENYGNLAAFIVVAKYIQIKQNSIANSIQKYLLQIIKCNRFKDSALWKRKSLLQWQHFMRHNIRYTHLQDELQDYNHFWTTYLSYAFFFYALLIALLIYIIFESNTEFYFKITLVIVLHVHLVLLYAIISISGSIVKRNSQLSFSLIRLTVHLVNSPLMWRQCFKVCRWSYFPKHTFINKSNLF